MTATLQTKTTDSIASAPGLSNTIRSEWIRIWRPSFRYGGFGVLASFSVLILYFIYSSLADPSAAAGPPGRTTAADIEKAGGMIRALGTVSTLAGIVVLSLWAIAAASDYDSGLIRVLVQAQPSRLRLLGGKIIALSFFTVLLSAATVFRAHAKLWNRNRSWDRLAPRRGEPHRDHRSRHHASGPGRDLERPRRWRDGPLAREAS